MHSLYLNYGITITTLGLIGYFLTHAKSALISGLASGAILVLISFFVNQVNFVKIIGKVVNVLLLGVFTWRTSLATIAFIGGAGEKLIPAILLALMAIVSLVVFVLSLKKE